MITIEKTFYIYILASKRNGTIYVGVTSDLEKRIWEHKNDTLDGFTKRYKVHLLVYYEDGGDALNAIQREKQIKKWNRAWKIRLIEKHNPLWIDLYDKENGILPLPRE
jgi:putative endonuclease